jgi:M6 family metalloprotease-like protein
MFIKYRYIIPGALLCACVLALLTIQSTQAAPASPDAFILTQPDGSSFTARQWGDEWNHGSETLDGYSILKMSDGWWVYAELMPDGQLGPALNVAEPRRVGIDPPDDLPLHLRPAIMDVNPHSLESMRIGQPAQINPNPEAPEYLGSIKTLVLLAKFTDQAETYTAASFQPVVFSTSSSSLRLFYRETSYNQLDILPAEETCGTANDGITDWTLLGYEHPNTPLGPDNQNIVKDVLIASNSCVNFAQFDTNVDGYISSTELAIVVIVAGYEGGASDGLEPAIWGHTWHLDDVGVPVLDGKRLADDPYGSYIQLGERWGDTRQAGFGLFAHEFGHVINWPDLYDVDGSSEGVGAWSIMGTGNWNRVPYVGDSPAQADAWLKWYQGWLTPTIVSGTLSHAAIPRVEDHASAYLLRPNTNQVDWKFMSNWGYGEFFLVENRQKVLYDSGLPGCGLLIWHLDEFYSYANNVNADEDHPMVWLEQADGLNHLHEPWTGGGNRGDDGDPYPGSTDNDTFNNVTDPDSHLYGGGFSYVTVHVDSTDCASTMYADLSFLPPTGPANFEKSLPADGVGGRGVTLLLDWEEPTTATEYEYCVDQTVNSTCNADWISTGSLSQVNISGLTRGRTYEWQVRASNSFGTTYASTGTWWTFSTAYVTFTRGYRLPQILGGIGEGFEAGVMPPDSWTQVITNSDHTWEIGFNRGQAHGGWRYAIVHWDPDLTPVQDEVLISPYFVVPSSGGSLSFYSKGSLTYCRDISDNCDLEIWLVTGSWDSGSGDDLLLGVADDDWPASWTWAHSVFNYSPYVLPGTTVRFAFRYHGSNGAQIYLDDIILNY